MISGKHTASGKPILANDPHLQFSIPSVWYQVHLQAPGLNVTGVSLPGVPCVIIGHNERIAWGVTNLGFDVQDLYAERLDSQNGRYVYRGQLEQARLESEWIAIKGARPVEFQQWVTRHGPVRVYEQNRLLALRWTAADTGFFPISVSRFEPRGELAGVHRGSGAFSGAGTEFRLRRRGWKHRLPRGRQTSHPEELRWRRARWMGVRGITNGKAIIPFEELPSSYNPPQGRIVTANQNPFPQDYPYRVHGDFAAPFRATEASALLGAREGWKPEDMLRVEKDVYSTFSVFLAHKIVAAYDQNKRTNSDLKDAIALLRSWNGQMEKQTAAPLLISAGISRTAENGRGSSLVRRGGCIRAIHGAGRGRGHFKAQPAGLVQR